MTAYAALAAQCEGAEASEQREFLKRAFRALPRVEEYYWQRSDWGLFNRLLCAEAFVDAAIMLVPEGLTALIDTRCAHARIYQSDGEVGHTGLAVTPALALTAAALKARA